ncbi:MAG: MDR/zinc-dependent alcohol dehydrogenase-like family protein [Syntrophothermus sp.]
MNSNTTVSEETVSYKEAEAGQMRAAVITAPRQVKICQASIPEPGPDEVRIRMEGSGVCASSIPVWQGREWFSYPQEAGSPGHEGWGTVDKTGDHVKYFSKGDRVACISYHAFAEYDIAHKDALVRLPESLHAEYFPGEPLGCAANIFRRSNILHGHTVAIIGAGFLGALLIQMAKIAGVHIIAVSKRSFSQELAESLGADTVLPLNKNSAVVEQVKVLTRGQFCDRVIETTGLQDPLTLAGEITGINGKLIIAGYHQDGHRTVDMQLWNWKGIDVINAHERDTAKYVSGIKEAVRLMEKGIIRPLDLITHVYTLDELSAAMDAASERKDGFIKAVVKI